MRPAAVIIMGALLLAAGCRSNRWERVREDESRAYRTDLQEETTNLLARYPGGLDLTQCVAIARERNTKYLASRIERKIAEVGRAGAFSVFLPQVQLSYTDLGRNEPPLRQINGNAIAMQDQDLQDCILTGRIQQHPD